MSRTKISDKSLVWAINTPNGKHTALRREELPHYNMNYITKPNQKYGELPKVDDLVNGAQVVNLLATQYFMGSVSIIGKDYKFIVTTFGVRFVRIIGQTWVSTNAEKRYYLVKKKD